MSVAHPTEVSVSVPVAVAASPTLVQHTYPLLAEGGLNGRRVYATGGDRRGPNAFLVTIQSSLSVFEILGNCILVSGRTISGRLILRLLPSN